MSAPKEKALATATNSHKSMNEFSNSAADSITRRPKKIHRIIAASDDTYHAICGHTFKKKYGVHGAAPSQDYVPCHQCEAMVRLKAELDHIDSADSF